MYLYILGYNDVSIPQSRIAISKLVIALSREPYWGLPRSPLSGRQHNCTRPNARETNSYFSSYFDMGVMYYIVMCHGIVTILPRKRGKCIMQIWGGFFFGSMGMERGRRRAWNKGGMVYNEFLYSFLRDFLIYQRSRIIRYLVLGIFLHKESQPSAKELTEKKVNKGEAIIETTSPWGLYACDAIIC